MSLLESLGLNPDVKKAYMNTTCNGKECPIETRNTIVSEMSSFYEIGIELRIRGDGNYVLESWTIFDSRHVQNHHCVLDSNGKLVSGSEGKVNCFSFGWVRVDQTWISVLIQEMGSALKSGKRKWTKIE